MAYYSYKDVCNDIPPHLDKKFEEEFGRKPDGNPNYDGDYWHLAAMWIEELQETIQELTNQIDKRY